MEHDRALEILRDLERIWANGTYGPSVRSYFAGKTDGIRAAIAVLVTADDEPVEV
jgi:hypothetical protein